ncbi:hypothetical protein PPERSA_10590 [Pseudocohnilembus persalinus]|uniref:Uncharacterized protein n=1 Tax=Pseudocohnilembus persalinus TaxID=266149 RepID=A0A0V0Q9B6_PSEPJ|nr:hypothetical protein PPERSA_10590 [Pseudocohnilembus persalinus]|eukprot:KRW98819.1 hypothetical protein PPERSA_10590 [Pseudocohnilembus persalinus]
MEKLNPQFYFEPYKLIESSSCEKDVFRGFLHQNYLNFYFDIEDVAEQAEVFQFCDIFQKVTQKQEKDDRIRTENQTFNCYFSGLGVMLNNKMGTSEQLKSQSQYRPIERSCDIEVYKFKKEFKKKYNKLQLDKKSFHGISSNHFISQFGHYLKEICPNELQGYQLFNQIQSTQYNGQNQYRSSNGNSNFQPLQQQQIKRWGRDSQKGLNEQDYKVDRDYIQCDENGSEYVDENKLTYQIQEYQQNELEDDIENVE